MMEHDLSKPAVTANIYAAGVITPIFTPFEESGRFASGHLVNLATRLSQIDGILGFAVNTTVRERLSLMLAERIEVVRSTRAALGSEKLVLACVGPLSGEVEAEVATCRDAGADAVITFPPRWRAGQGAPDFDRHIEDLVEIADTLPLPIIVAAGEGQNEHDCGCPDISSLAGKCSKVIGVDMGTHDNVLHYDQA